MPRQILESSMSDEKTRRLSGRQTGTILIRRHSVVTRVTHWLNVLCLTVLLLSELQKFNAHPELYWGQYGADGDPAFLTIRSTEDKDGLHGFVQAGGIEIPTTGFLGVSSFEGEPYNGLHRASAPCPCSSRWALIVSCSVERKRVSPASCFSAP
jgi:hypothetical protein